MCIVHFIGLVQKQIGLTKLFFYWLDKYQTIYLSGIAYPSRAPGLNPRFIGSFGSSLLVFWFVWFIFVGFLVRLVHLCWFFGLFGSSLLVFLVRLVHLCWFFGLFGSSLLVFWFVWFIFVRFLFCAVLCFFLLFCLCSSCVLFVFVMCFVFPILHMSLDCSLGFLWRLFQLILIFHARTSALLLFFPNKSQLLT